MPQLPSGKKSGTVPATSPGLAGIPMTDAPPAGNLPKPLVWTGRVMSGLLAVFLAFSAGIKLMHRPEVAETLTGLGWPATAGFPIGLLEATCLVLYLVPRTAILGAVLMTGLLGAAMATHIRVGSPLFSHILLAVHGALRLGWTVAARRQAARAAALAPGRLTPRTGSS